MTETALSICTAAAALVDAQRAQYDPEYLEPYDQIADTITKRLNDIGVEPSVPVIAAAITTLHMAEWVRRSELRRLREQLGPLAPMIDAATPPDDQTFPELAVIGAAVSILAWRLVRGES